MHNREPGDRKLAIVLTIRPKGSLVTASDTCRVCVHCGTTAVDLVLPAGIPIAVLIPQIVEILDIRDPDRRAGRYQLALPGAAALDPALTLTQNRINDGTVLVLSRTRVPALTRHYVDVAEAVSVTLDSTQPPAQHPRAARFAGVLAAACLTSVGGFAMVQNTFSVNAARDAAACAAVFASAAVLALGLAALVHRGYPDPVAGPALSMLATAFAAIAGFVAVPGTPSISNVLLAATAAAAASVTAMRTARRGVVTLTAVACVALVIAGAALGGMVSAAPLHIVGSVSALACLGLLGIAARTSIVLTGLSPRLPAAPDANDVAPAGAWVSAQAIRADSWLTSLLAGLSLSATVGAVVAVVAGAPRLSCTVFGAITSLLLLLRSRTDHRRRTLVSAAGGIVIAATTFGVAATRTPMPAPWIATATVLLVAAAMYLGFVLPAQALSPSLGRSVELLEWLALVAMVPLTCQISGLYGAVRGLNLT